MILLQERRERGEGRQSERSVCTWEREAGGQNGPHLMVCFSKRKELRSSARGEGGSSRGQKRARKLNGPKKKKRKKKKKAYTAALRTQLSSFIPDSRLSKCTVLCKLRRPHENNSKE